MDNFESIQFKGQLRDYQQRVIEQSDRYLKDHKIHIVAPPGSGKTILGLELIRKLNAPALILTPSLVIRQQWGDKFAEAFLNHQDVHKYVSYDLKHPRLLTCVTYQSLYGACQHIKIETKEENIYEQEDYQDLDVIQMMLDAHIQTICLDEAHHLKSEWQKSLENFLSQLPQDITMIALTATPPYDSTPQEWNRYMRLCGEIDEEIFVPELVASQHLCPHQDYVYFNYPTRQEMKVLQEHHKQMMLCLQDLLYGPLFQQAIQMAQFDKCDAEKEEFILNHISECVAVFVTAQFVGVDIPMKVIRFISPRGKLPSCTLEHIQLALQMIIDYPDIFSENISTLIRHQLSQHHLLQRRKVQLTSYEKINKMLVSSLGKLKSIEKIVEAESQSLKEDLRMLILTDYIQKDFSSLIGTDQELMSLSCVTLFESLRRLNREKKIAVLSGSFVLVPDYLQEKIVFLMKEEKMSCQFLPFVSTGYSQVVGYTSQRKVVQMMTQFFEEGYIHILIGTRSLLGEGWDCPSVQSLILASTVGSFVLSNQMRGRAMRIDRTNPDKTAHIWHLVTIEPPLTPIAYLHQNLFHILGQNQVMNSYDYEILKRRFDCFLGPAYHQYVIESGIERLDIISPPYTRENIESINQQMLELAADRETMKKSWEATLQGQVHPHVRQTSRISQKVLPKSYVFQNACLLVLLDIIFTIVTRIINHQVNIYADTFIRTVIADIALTIIGVMLARFHLQLLQYLTPKRMIYAYAKALLETLQEIGDIQKENVFLDIELDDETEQYIDCSLAHATLHEQTLFATSLKELFSGIDNPRYILIQKTSLLGLQRKNYMMSFPCPNRIGSQKEYAEIFHKHLCRVHDFSLVYTRQEKGRQELLKCRRFSYWNMNNGFITGKKMMKKDWE